MIFRERSICYVGNFTKMPQMNKRFSCLGYVSELKRLDKFLISCDVAPLWTFPSEKIQHAIVIAGNTLHLLIIGHFLLSLQSNFVILL